MCARFMRGYLLLALVALAALTACGDNGGAGTTGTGAGTTMAGGGIGGTGISFGTVQKFGSIFVNGVEFNTDNAQVIKDDNAAPFSELQLGMTVEVHGSIDSATSGVAQAVLIDEAVRGPVQSVDTAKGQFTVLGQTVVVDNTTMFDSTLSGGLSALKKGTMVEVFGFIKGAGAIGASLIEPAQTTTLSVRGFINPGTQNLSTKTFTMGALTVDYSSANTDGLPPPPSTWEPLYLDIKARSCSPQPCQTLFADSVDFEGFSGIPNVSTAQTEGFIMHATPANNEFVIAGQTVAYTPATVFVGGTAADLALGTRVEIEGSIAGGIFTATKITFEDNVQLEGDVATANPDSAKSPSGSFALAGLAPITVEVNSQTDISNASGGISGLTTNEHVRVRGRVDPQNANAVIATELEMRSADTTVVLQGPAHMIMPDTSVTILGITVPTNGMPPIEFTDLNDNSIDSAAFFGALHDGDLVKVKGDLISSPTTSVTWNEIELEE